jgi:hypothetical protein
VRKQRRQNQLIQADREDQYLADHASILAAKLSLDNWQST